MSEDNMVTVNKYFNYLKEGKLMGSECPSCQNVDLPARRLCSKCQKEAKWKELSGSGKIHAFSAIFVGTPVMGQKGYDRKNPYIFTVAKMDEGPMISGLMRNSEHFEKDPSQVKIGMQIKATYYQTQIGSDKENNPIYRSDVGFEPVQ